MCTLQAIAAKLHQAAGPPWAPQHLSWLPPPAMPFASKASSLPPCVEHITAPDGLQPPTAETLPCLLAASMPTPQPPEGSGHFPTERLLPPIRSAAGWHSAPHSVQSDPPPGTQAAGAGGHHPLPCPPHAQHTQHSQHEWFSMQHAEAALADHLATDIDGPRPEMPAGGAAVGSPSQVHLGTATAADRPPQPSLPPLPPPPPVSNTTMGVDGQWLQGPPHSGPTYAFVPPAPNVPVTGDGFRQLHVHPHDVAYDQHALTRPESPFRLPGFGLIMPSARSMEDLRLNMDHDDLICDDELPEELYPEFRVPGSPRLYGDNQVGAQGGDRPSARDL